MTHKGYVVHVIAPAQHGGAETVVRALAIGNPLMTVVVLLLPQKLQADDATELARALEAAGISVVRISWGRRAYLREVLSLRRTLRTIGSVRVMHTHGYHANFVGLIAARLSRIPAVSTVHGYVATSRLGRLYNLLDVYLLRHFDAVIAVSQELVTHLRTSGIAQRTIHYIPNGLPPASASLSRGEARLRLGVDSAAPTIGWVGRLSPEKGPDLLVQAVRLMKVRANVVVIGDGPLLREIKALSAGGRSGRLQNPFCFMGSLTEAASYFRAFDVLALTSRSEGMPMVLLEAAAQSVPIVAFSVGDIGNAFDSNCAWLVPPGDTAEFARSLDYCLSHPKEASRKATNAASRVSLASSTAHWLRQVDSVYEQLS